MRRFVVINHLVTKWRTIENFFTTLPKNRDELISKNLFLRCVRLRNPLFFNIYPPCCDRIAIVPTSVLTALRSYGFLRVGISQVFIHYLKVQTKNYIILQKTIRSQYICVNFIWALLDKIIYKITLNLTI